MSVSSPSRIKEEDERGDVLKTSSCWGKTSVALPGSTKSPTNSSISDESEEFSSEDMKLLVTDDILWVVKPVDCGWTDSRQMEVEVDGFLVVRRVRALVLVFSAVKSRLRTRRPLRVTDFKHGFSDESMLII